jgi:DivIVA domain-containing protein
VRDLLLTLAVALVLGLIVFGAVAFTLGRASGLEPAAPDAAPHDLPQDRPAAPSDLDAIRFDVVPRGYRMDQVDGVLERAGHELGARDAELLALRQELWLLRADNEHPTGAHAVRPDPDLDRTEVFRAAAGVYPDHVGAAGDDPAGDLGEDDAEAGPEPDTRPAPAGDDTAVLGDLLGNERHPR